MVIKSSPEPTTPPKRPSSAGKGKNRLPAPTASPGLYFPPAPSPSDPQVDVNDLASVTSNVSSSSSASFRFPHSILKELAQDIEESGGFQKFLLDQAEDQLTIRALCNKKTHIYGKRDDPLRKRIRKKISYRKGLHLQDDYLEKVLNKYQVKSWANLQYDKKQKVQSKRLSFDDTTIDSDSEASGGAASIGDNRSTSSSTTIPDRVFVPKKKTETPKNKSTEKVAQTPTKKVATTPTKKEVTMTSSTSQPTSERPSMVTSEKYSSLPYPSNAGE
jgi:hypothetical protein